jgi:hypothetical protein
MLNPKIGHAGWELGNGHRSPRSPTTGM